MKKPLLIFRTTMIKNLISRVAFKNKNIHAYKILVPKGNIGPKFMNVSIIFVNVFSVTAVRVGAEIAPCAFQAITALVCLLQRYYLCN